MAVDDKRLDSLFGAGKSLKISGNQKTKVRARSELLRTPDWRTDDLISKNVHQPYQNRSTQLKILNHHQKLNLTRFKHKQYKWAESKTKNSMMSAWKIISRGIIKVNGSKSVLTSLIPLTFSPPLHHYSFSFPFIL